MSDRPNARIAAGIMAAVLAAALLEWLPGRTIIIVIGLLVAPGLALASVSSVEERVTLMLLAVPVSVVIVGLVSTAAIYLGVWDPLVIIALVASITFLAAAVSSRERAARLVLVGLTILPGIVVLAASISTAEI